MPNLQDIKRRIRSVKNTQQITKAMKLVAASKLRKAQEAISNQRPYALKMIEVINHLAARCNQDLHPLLDNRHEQRVIMVVISSDKGLCGGFNASILKSTIQVIEKYEGKELEFIAVGKKGRDFLSNRNKKILKEYVNWTKDFNFQDAAEIGKFLSEAYESNATDKVYVIYNEFKSVIQQKVTVEQVLPIVPEVLDLKENEFAVDYIYEPDEETILDDLLKRYMNVNIYRACLESIASEHGARMTAMDNATRNAKEMISDLTLFYNRTRQAHITKELIEVVNGSEALKG